MHTLLLVLILLLSFSPQMALGGVGKEEFFALNEKLKEQNYSGAETVLKEYLLERSVGHYEKSVTFLSETFQKKFFERSGYTYLDYYRNQNESYYKDFKILSTKRLDHGIVLIVVTVDVEGPGYKSKALENYYMSQERGVWKIYDWNIEYKKKEQ
jgi:hypothetical protein